MKSFILFMMFFSSPPAPPGKQVWALNSTSQLEFTAMAACISFGKKFQDSLVSTATTTVRAWCVNREIGGSTTDKTLSESKGPENQDYYAIPAPNGH